MKNLIIQFVVFVLSLAALIVFAERLIDASTRLAKALGITEAAIGLTLLAYGTSLPEFAISSISSVSQHPELSIANITGSNIFNIAFIIGLAAFIRPFSIKHMAGRDNYIMLAATLFLAALLFFFEGISRISGIIMVFMLACYTYFLLRHEASSGMEKDRTISKSKETGIILACILVVIVSGKLAVDSAVEIVEGLGVTEWLIGATIVAAGTSLPELAVSITAAKKGFFGMSIGNIIGSNIFNIMWVLGFAAVLNPIYVSFAIIKWDIVFLLAATFLLPYHLIKTKVSRRDGVLYVALYLAYIAHLIG